MERTMMISVPGAWDSYRPDELHRQLEPAYTAKELLINLAGARHVTDTLLTELLELRNHREHRGLEAALIVVNWPFVRNLLELSGFDRLSESSIRLRCPRASHS
jgi:anti-anti-sigma regulatory factor